MTKVKCNVQEIVHEVVLEVVPEVVPVADLAQQDLVMRVVIIVQP